MAKVFAFDYDQYDLDNGLRLITVPLPYPHVVAAHIVVGAGSRNEVEPGKSGFAHFFEHMMFRGTPEYPPAKYEAVLQETGASSNAYTDDDRTVYHTTVTNEDLEIILAMEADRFRNLAYPLEDFRTEALAVYGEYNKDSTEPLHKMFEVLRDAAFDVHTYKHTTMGFLADIVEMPNHYDYSRQFFDRFYRPEYTTIVICGDVTPQRSRALVERHWGPWQRGGYRCEVPAEPAPAAARERRIEWQTPTLPHLLLGWRGPAYDDAKKDAPALDLISFLAFSETSDLFQKLVIDEQSVDVLWSSNADHVDPYLFTVLARVKDPAQVAGVRRDIEATLERFREEPVDAQRLENVKKHLRYRFALGMNNAEAVASTLAHYVSLRRTPETINRLYDVYESLTPEDVMQIARRYFVESGRTAVTLENAR